MISLSISLITQNVATTIISLFAGDEDKEFVVYCYRKFKCAIIYLDSLNLDFQWDIAHNREAFDDNIMYPQMSK